MSKSKGNTVDPMEIIEKYGADALRFFMAAMETQGRDINVSESRIQGYRNFATKLWNSARFGEMNECVLTPDFDAAKVSHPVNKWIIEKVKQTSNELTDNLNNYRFSDSANGVYQFVWGSFCDWYIEMIKPILYGEDEQAKAETRATFAWVLNRILIILHPFMPFVTAELWNNYHSEEDIINAQWPAKENVDDNAIAHIDWAIELISAIRSLRAEMNLPAGSKLTAYLQGANEQSANNVNQFANIICAMARLEKIELYNGEITPDMVQTVFRENTVLIPLKGIVDFAAERERLQKELAGLNKNLEGYARKLNNPAFVDKAPAAVVEEERRRQAEALENKAKVEEALQRIVGL
jgi:valyl-tRNA synthetase